VGLREVRSRELTEMSCARTVLFVCLHGAAKSVIASAYLNQLAAERGLNLRGTAAGIEPEPEIPVPVREGLLQDGLDVSQHHPRRVTAQELGTASRVVSFGCNLSPVASSGLAVERWDDVPLVSDGYPAARDEIVRRVQRLLDGYEP
jgi:protein-tyrosine-phosphatase